MLKMKDIFNSTQLNWDLPLSSMNSSSFNLCLVLLTLLLTCILFTRYRDEQSSCVQRAVLATGSVWACSSEGKVFKNSIKGLHGEW